MVDEAFPPSSIGMVVKLSKDLANENVATIWTLFISVCPLRYRMIQYTYHIIV